MFLKKLFSLSTLTLITALTLSGIAAWYSILGLCAIFAAAVVPIIVMGAALEVAKVVTTVWVHRYWKKANWMMKAYLVPAILALALITSMGIFGFLSKAHMDQNIPSGDVSAQVALLDEKIKTQRDNIQVQRDNIAASRATLSQMDAQVTARLDRGTTEQGAERAVTIRKQQKSERAAINKEITAAQTEIGNINSQIAKLNEERVPIASKLRKVEAEVGPIKYIAALIYGDNPDQNLLERAVRWVIILLVTVFDPLALCLVIASISSRKWEDEVVETVKDTPPTLDEDDDHAKLKRVMEAQGVASVPPIVGAYEPDDGPLTTEELAAIQEEAGPRHEESAASSLVDEIKEESEDSLKKRMTDWSRSPVLNLCKKLFKPQE